MLTITLVGSVPNIEPSKVISLVSLMLEGDTALRTGEMASDTSKVQSPEQRAGTLLTVTVTLNWPSVDGGKSVSISMVEPLMRAWLPT